MLELDINEINAIGEGLIDRREAYRADTLRAVYEAVVIAINNTFGADKIKKLPLLRLRQETPEEIAQRMQEDFAFTTDLINENKQADV
jgi:hypothetical protein